MTKDRSYLFYSAITLRRRLFPINGREFRCPEIPNSGIAGEIGETGNQSSASHRSFHQHGGYVAEPG